MKGIDPQLGKFFIIKQILLFSTRGNVLKLVWRISILILECRGLGTTKLCNKSQDVLAPFVIKVSFFGGESSQTHYCKRYLSN